MLQGCHGGSPVCLSRKYFGIQGDDVLKKKMGLRTNLIVGALVVTGFIASTVISYQTSYKIAVENTEEISQRTSDLVYNKISNYFATPIRVSQTMAKDELLCRLLAEREEANGSEVEQVISSYLKTYQEEYEYDTAFLITASDGTYYTAQGLDRVLTEDNEENDWYYSFLESDNEYALDIDNDEIAGADNAQTFFVDYKVKNAQNEVLGVVGVGIKLEDVQEMIRDINVESYGTEAYLVDEDGKVMISRSFKAEESAKEDNGNVTAKEPAKEDNEEAVAEKAIKQDNEEVTEDTQENFFDGEDKEKMRKPILGLKGTDDVTQLWNENADPQKEEFVVARYIPELSWYLIIQRNNQEQITKIYSQIYKNLAITGVLLVLLLVVINHVVKKYEKKVTELTRELAEKDEMTDCYTKVATGRHIDRELKEHPKKKYAFFIFDIDNFKHANDEHGHAFGDYVITEFAKTVKKSFDEESVVGRIGGDEFVVLMPVHDRKGAEKKAKEVSSLLNRECVMQEQHWEMSASIGIVLAPADGRTYEELYRNADLALYETKRNGKNGYAVFAQDMKKD